MKLSTTLATSILLAGMAATNASADNKVMPELLSGIASDAVALTSDEAADTRGERVRVRKWKQKCAWKFCTAWPDGYRYVNVTVYNPFTGTPYTKSH